MLVLTRKIGESIMIGNDIEVKVLKIEGNSVKLGITAPSSVRVYRMEIYEEIAKQNKQSLMGIDLVKNMKGVLKDDNK